MPKRPRDVTDFERIRAELEPIMRRFIGKMLGDNDAADDIIQEAFFALHLRMQGDDAIREPRPFLYRVVRNRCYDELRRLGRSRALFTGQSDLWEEEISIVADDRLAPDEALARSIAYSELQLAMSRLPEAQRQTLILHCEEGFSYEQIAEAMGVDPGTVGSRLHHARKNLRRLVRKESLEALGFQFDDSTENNDA